nr:tripartite motif-containing protein 12A-like [Lytechinus pictus]
MTSEFSSIVEGAVCEETHCESITDVTFYVKEKKKLCHDCALKKECIGIVRRGEPNLFCQEHNELMRLYCRTHNVALCYPCALTDHRQQHCAHEDIMIALKKNRKDLNILKNRAIDKSEICRIHGIEIYKTRQAKDQHLQTIQNDVDSEIENAIKRDRAREREDADLIDKEIDRENEQLQEEIRKIHNKIQKNNEKREKRHEENRLNAEKRRQPITDKQHILHADIQNVAQEIERKIGELQKSWQDDTKSAEKAT